MINLSKLKASAWARVVEELSAPAPSDRVFVMRLVSVLGQVAGARQALLWSVDGATEDGEQRGEANVLFAWPSQAIRGDSPETPTVEHEDDAKAAASSAASSGAVQVFGIEDEETPFYSSSSSGKGVLISVPISGLGGADPDVGKQHAITILIESRSNQAIQTTAALVEVLAGYVHTHAARQSLRAARAAGAALDLATRLIASINNSANFKGATLQLTNDLMRQLHVDRVAIGWVKGHRRIGQEHESETVRVIAISDTEHIDRRMTMVQRLEAAMDECLDQEHAVVFPVPEIAPDAPEDSDPLLTHAIAHSHRELAAGDAKLKVASVPLRADDRVIGVVTVESASDEPIDLRTIELVQATLDLITPVLELRKSDDRALPVRSFDEVLRVGAWVVGPKHTVWKLVGLAAMLLFAVVTFVHVPYRIEADATILPRERRVVSVPYDGIIVGLGDNAAPDKRVEAGEVLARLDTTEIKLTALEAEANLMQAETEADAHLKANELGEYRQALARAEAARVRLEWATERIARAEITAPIAGTIISGDLEDRIGASVSLGDPLFEIAPLDVMVVLAEVDDRDIAMIEAGGPGQIATKAYPDRKFDLEVERVVPLARPEEGKNIFEVRAVLESPAGWMRPGLEGIAKFDTGDKSIAWILSRRIRDTIRLWMWW